MKKVLTEMVAELLDIEERYAAEGKKTTKEVDVLRAGSSDELAAFRENCRCFHHHLCRARERAEAALKILQQSG